MPLGLPNFIKRPDEDDYKMLRDMGAKLKIPVIECFITAQVNTPDGKIAHLHSERAKSWNRNFYNLFATMGLSTGTDAETTFEAGALTLKDTGGTIRYTAGTATVRRGYGLYGANYAIWEKAGNYGYGFFGAAADSNYGIVIGTDDGAESFEGYALGAIINNGTGAGQMSYVANTICTRTYVAGTKTWSTAHERFINNNSGGAITVKECGIYSLLLYSATNGKFMIARDVLASSIAVADTAQLKVTYTLSMVFPS